ncbi:hypothetical protein SALBM135S_01395 [Streptomyces alboniger]
MDTTGKLTGVYLPAGDYETSNKFQVYGKAVEVVGAGPWYTRFHAPKSQENTDIGFRAEASAKGSSFSGFAYFGNYTSRIDGPGKVFDFQNVSDITIDDIWNEHMVCLYWGANTDRVTIKNSRIRNMFADGVNMTNGSTDNLVSNNEARATGDDSFALFSAIDAGGADMKNNVYENLTTILTWRAAGRRLRRLPQHLPQHPHSRTRLTGSRPGSPLDGGELHALRTVGDAVADRLPGVAAAGAAGSAVVVAGGDSAPGAAGEREGGKTEGRRDGADAHVTPEWNCARARASLQPRTPGAGHSPPLAECRRGELTRPRPHRGSPAHAEREPRAGVGRHGYRHGRCARHVEHRGERRAVVEAVDPAVAVQGLVEGPRPTRRHGAVMMSAPGSAAPR